MPDFQPHGRRPGYIRLMNGCYRGTQYQLAVVDDELLCFIGTAAHVWKHDGRRMLLVDWATDVIYPDFDFTDHVNRIADRHLEMIGS